MVSSPGPDRPARPDRPDPIREAHRQWVRHGWADAADAMAVVTSLVRVHQLLHERIDAVLRPLGLTFARYEVLRLLAFTTAGSLPMTRLGSLLQVHPTSVTSAVDRLERQGFVVRERQSADRRVVRAAITDTGRAVVEEATVGLNDSVFGELGLDPDETADLTRLLSTYRRHAGDRVEPGEDGV
ncbi:MarR family transcriptional regulator [Nocardioides sp. HDW12B]|uniref:MarR family winged helix-turn-helix transcriptional regulator n=1 Tax=Nocardioides sp. HDW12B TaxID=2714939 RepID=UPI001F0FC8D2|nr:MarR family transcriptional regulator [Nocardioides sp. HDW12B]